MRSTCQECPCYAPMLAQGQPTGYGWCARSHILVLADELRCEEGSLDEDDEDWS